VTRLVTPLLLAALACFICAAAHAQDGAAEEFFKGKTLRIVVGAGVGSGYDITARILARHMPAHIPGNPAFIVQNPPGACGLTLTNSLNANVPFDGTVLGAPFNGPQHMPLFQPQTAHFHPDKLSYLGCPQR